VSLFQMSLEQLVLSLFLWLLCPPLLPIMAIFGSQEHTHDLHLHTEFQPDQFVMSPLRGKNSKFDVKSSTFCGGAT